MLEILTLVFFQRALVVGLILGALLAILGVFVVLRRLSFFADAIGHAALPGIALGVIWSFNPFWSGLAVVLIMALIIAAIRQVSRIHLDTLLGIFFPAALSLGVIIMRAVPGYQGDLLSFLFGDILTVQVEDIYVSLGLVAVVAAVMLLAGKKFLAITFDESLARAEGVAVQFYETLFLLVLAAVIALAIKIVGIVLITAMLVVPAATAQNVATSLRNMFGLSFIVSIVAVFCGMILSAIFNLPSGAAIVLTAAVIFGFSLLARAVKISV